MQIAKVRNVHGPLNLVLNGIVFAMIVKDGEMYFIHDAQGNTGLKYGTEEEATINALKLLHGEAI